MDFPFYVTYRESVDDAEKAYGEEIANRMAWEIFKYGTTGKREQEFPPGIECILTIIQAKIDKSQERKERVMNGNGRKAKDSSAK